MKKRGCSYCDDRSPYGDIFHQPCAQRSQHPDERLLCPHCRHLNPRHLFIRHVAGWLPSQNTSFSLGTTIEVMERARKCLECPLCSLVAAVVRRGSVHTSGMAIAVVIEFHSSHIAFCQNFDVKLLLPHNDTQTRGFSKGVTLEKASLLSATNIAVHDRTSLPKLHWLTNMAGTIYENASPSVSPFSASSPGPMTMALRRLPSPPPPCLFQLSAFHATPLNDY